MCLINSSHCLQDSFTENDHEVSPHYVFDSYVWGLTLIPENSSMIKEKSKAGFPNIPSEVWNMKRITITRSLRPFCYTFVTVTECKVLRTPVRNGGLLSSHYARYCVPQQPACSILKELKTHFSREVSWVWKYVAVVKDQVPSALHFELAFCIGPHNPY